MLMLENWRFNRALEAYSKRAESDRRQIFLDEEYRTQTALNQLGVKDNKSPSEIPHVGTLLMAPELIPNLRVPYAVEVLGMPRSGKSTVIDRYLRELWSTDEDQFMYGLENTPIQVGGIIMFMIRPEESMRRSEKPGPVANMDFLPRLYEQYWRLHWDILQSEIPYRIYTCIDAEKDGEDIYERFKYAMDSALNIHSIYLDALAKAFPQEFDRVKAEYDKRPRQLSRTQRVLEEKLGGKKVLIVGGDEMETEEQIFNRPFIEGIKLKR